MLVEKRALTAGLLLTCAFAAVLTSRLHTMSAATRMPVAFVGHGSPMSGLELNQFSKGWARMGKEFPRPRAILCVSAHWETSGTHVTFNTQPRTIHDFYGFPKELYAMEYPAPGSPDLARRVAQLTGAELDDSWGFDHGSWTILTHMYPEADIPVIQLSLDRKKTPQQHFDVGRRLAPLREEGVLILGSGNVVHNLRTVDRSGLGKPQAWALSVSQKVCHWIQERDFGSVVRYKEKGHDFEMAINSAEHFLPLLYVLGAAAPEDGLRVVSDKMDWGTLDMSSYIFSPSSTL